MSPFKYWKSSLSSPWSFLLSWLNNPNSLSDISLNNKSPSVQRKLLQAGKDCFVVSSHWRKALSYTDWRNCEVSSTRKALKQVGTWSMSFSVPTNNVLLKQVAIWSCNTMCFTQQVKQFPSIPSSVSLNIPVQIVCPSCRGQHSKCVGGHFPS